MLLVLSVWGAGSIYSLYCLWWVLRHFTHGIVCVGCWVNLLMVLSVWGSGSIYSWYCQFGILAQFTHGIVCVGCWDNLVMVLSVWGAGSMSNFHIITNIMPSVNCISTIYSIRYTLYIIHPCLFNIKTVYQMIQSIKRMHTA